MLKTDEKYDDLNSKYCQFLLANTNQSKDPHVSKNLGACHYGKAEPPHHRLLAQGCLCQLWALASFITQAVDWWWYFVMQWMMIQSSSVLPLHPSHTSHPSLSIPILLYICSASLIHSYTGRPACHLSFSLILKAVSLHKQANASFHKEICWQIY